MRTVWLLRGGDVLASGEIAESLFDRARGLLGHQRYDGALLLMQTRAVHTAGMRFAVDVAFLDKDLRVLSTKKVRAWSVALPRRGACHILEAQAGAFERWRLQPGDQIEVREAA